MTELEKMKRAKMYIDKLAQGINPINDESADENDIINNVRISRCLFYVSDILRQVIDNDGQIAYKSKTPGSKKLPFCVSEEALSGFEFSSLPMPISTIASRLSDLVDENVYKKMDYKKIRDWLVSLDMLAEGTMPNGKTSFIPTESGIAAGISMEVRTGRNGNYSVVVYNLEAQQFIIDNIEAILAGQEL